MSQVTLKSTPPVARDDRDQGPPRLFPGHVLPKARIQVLPVLITLGAVALGAALSWTIWQAYMETPSTRDGTVRAYVVTMAPEVAGRIVELPLADNQFVHKGDLLMVIDPTNFSIAVRQAEAAVEQARAVSQNAQIQSQRRQ